MFVRAASPRRILVNVDEPIPRSLAKAAEQTCLPKNSYFSFFRLLRAAAFKGGAVCSPSDGLEKKSPTRHLILHHPMAPHGQENLTHESTMNHQIRKKSQSHCQPQLLQLRARPRHQAHCLTAGPDVWTIQVSLLVGLSHFPIKIFEPKPRLYKTKVQN